MAIDLRLLPEPITLKKGLSLLCWGVALLVFVIIGLICVFIIQFTNDITSKHMLIGVVISVISWFVIFCLWLYSRGCKEVYAESWNRIRKEQEQQLISFGQKPLYVIYCQLSSEFGNNNHAQAMVNGLFSIDAKPINLSGNIQKSVIYSQYPFNGLKPNDFYQKITVLFDDLQPVFTVLNHSIFNANPKHIRLFIDAPVSGKDIEKIWQEKFGEITDFHSWQIIDAKLSPVFLDSWLDDVDHDNHLLCCISLHLFEYPTAYSAEAMTTFICLGHKLLEDKKIYQYIQENKRLLVTLHRTEEGDKLDHVLNQAELWGNLNDEQSQLDRLWLNSLSPEANVKILSRYTESRISMKNSHQINTLFGVAGYCDYWVALALAIEYTAYTKDNQLIIGEKNKRFNATVINRLSL
ncbi:MAG: hypothetical protein J6562_06030 [Candidatus Schmidhempelia sp.]|nr:hypothetical protein [Candidatus Schmidhempelia sp.]